MVEVTLNGSVAGQYSDSDVGIDILGSGGDTFEVTENFYMAKNSEPGTLSIEGPKIFLKKMTLFEMVRSMSV